MTFARTKTAGWTAGIDTITAAQINDVDLKTSQAIDGTAGGTYTPGSVIDIGGSGIRVTGTSNVLLASRSITRVQSCTGACPGAWGTWVPDTANGGLWTNYSVAGSIVLPLRVPHGATLTSVAVRIDPDNGHAAFPGGAPTAPTLKLYGQVFSTGVTSLLGSTTDSVAVKATYEAVHSITISGLSEVIDRSLYSYCLILASESGANHRPGTILHGATATYTITAYDED